MADVTCSVHGCDRKVRTRGMCHKHYLRAWRRGEISVITREERFWSQVEKTENCWNWTGQIDGGYGRFYPARAHRVAYESAIGPIPSGMLIDHRCHNKICVNPDHLRLATQKQNLENRAPRKPTNKSGIRGVFWHKDNRNWIVYVGHNSRQQWGGAYRSIEEAEQAAIALRNKLFTHNDLDRQESA